MKKNNLKLNEASALRLLLLAMSYKDEKCIKNGFDL